MLEGLYLHGIKFLPISTSSVIAHLTLSLQMCKKFEYTFPQYACEVLCSKSLSLLLVVLVYYAKNVLFYTHFLRAFNYEVCGDWIVARYFVAKAEVIFQ